MNKLSDISSQVHELFLFEHLGGIDTFFGRLELFESELGKRHGNNWRKLGRYGNIVFYEPTVETIDFCLDHNWEMEWLVELSSWYKTQSELHQMPDCATLFVIIDFHLKGFLKA